MNTIKFLKNSLKINSTGFIRCNNQLKEKRLWCLNRGINYSTAMFIRNTGGSGHSTIIDKSKGFFNHHNLLPPQIQTNFSANVFNSCCLFGTSQSPDRANKSDTKAAAVAEADIFGEASKLGLFAKFKLMYKKYWYVLIPVHVVTSAGWMCGFYYLSKSGVDIPSLLEHLHLSETIVDKIKTSSLGHWAVAYLCFKVATPLRYAVTLGGTTISIRHFVQKGQIKPIPSKEELVRMYTQQKAHRASMKANAEKEQQQESQNK